MGRDGAVLLLQHIHRAVQMSDSFVIGTGDFWSRCAHRHFTLTLYASVDQDIIFYFSALYLCL